MADRIKQVPELPGKTIQRQSVEEFFSDFYEKQRSHPVNVLHLYTDVKQDGLGDAGQIGFLKKKLESVKAGMGLETIIPHLTYAKADKEDMIRKLAGTDANNMKYIRKANPPTKEDVFATHLSQDDWQIHYPVPTKHILPGKNVLKIKEMGASGGDMLKAGLLYGGIGYGIPDISDGKDENLTTDERSILDHEEDSKKISDLLSTAWLVMVKPYTKDGTSEIEASHIVEIAKDKTSLLIFSKDISNMLSIRKIGTKKCQKGLMAILKKDNLFILSASEFNNPFLHYLMNHITDGVIMAGGEGMYAEALATTNNSAAVLAGRYEFQYDEIADHLTKNLNTGSALDDKLSGLEEKTGLTLAEAQKYGVVVYEDKFFVYIRKGGTDILKSIKTGDEKLIDSISSENTYKVSKSLSALYLPLAVNTHWEIHMPGIFGGDFQSVLAIYKARKDDLRTKHNWFNTIPMKPAAPQTE